jgi:glutaredoxin
MSTARADTKTSDSSRKQARVHRMVMPEHVCPYGLKTVHLLKSHGFEVDDRHLETREETDAFKRKHEVDTTPQVFIDGERIGGYEALREYLGLSVRSEDELRYTPVLMLFAVAALMALALTVRDPHPLLSLRTLEAFVAIAMSLLGLQKLKDVESFSTMFLNYDLLARRWVPYGYFYPYAETLAGVLMLAGALIWLAAPLAIFIGSVGAVSVFKAVYIDRRELKCACVGGDSQVPLGFVSLSESLVMLAMGIWMPLRMYGLAG